MTSQLPGGIVRDSATQQNLVALAKQAGSVPNVLEIGEQEAPSAPKEGRVRIFAKDNAGKTQLLALFHTGEEQVIAEEP